MLRRKGPGGMLTKENCPSSPDNTSRSGDSSRRLILTQAPTMKPPVASTRVPEMLPEVCGSGSDPRTAAAGSGAAGWSLVAEAATGGASDWARVRKPQSRILKLSPANLALYVDNRHRRPAHY